MRIGIDIDDTITETASLIDDVLMENRLYDLDNDFDSYGYEELKSYSDIISENIYKVLKNCPIKNNAVEVIKHIKDLGHEIYIITARNNLYSKNVIDITISFLKEHGIIYDKIIFDCDEKKSVCLDNKIDIMLDDKASLIENLENTKTVGILFTAPFNKDSKCRRVNNWLEFKSIIDNWR